MDELGLQSGFPLFVQQFKALLRKNSLLSWRSKRATFLQLFASFFFVLILFSMRKSEDAKSSASTAYVDSPGPHGLVSPPVPPCEDNAFVKKPCFDFVWSGHGSAKIQTIVESIMNNNPGRPIPSQKVKSFRTKAVAEKWLYRNPMHCSGALHFVERNSSVISYGVQVNSTSPGKRGRFEDPTFKLLIPLQIAAEREIARSLIGDRKFSWIVSLKEFAHPAMKVPSGLEGQAPSAFFAAALFGFVLQMGSLIEERELKLRTAMSMMGLYDSAYWLSWIIWEGLMTLISSLLIVLFGLMFQFEFFLKTRFSDLFLLFSLFQLNMLGLAFFLSSFFSKSSSSTIVGFSMFIIGVMTQTATTLGYIYIYTTPKMFRIVWSFFSPNLLCKALSLLMEESSTNQEQFIANRPARCPPNNPYCEIITVNEIFIWLASTFVLWISLAIYFDNVIPDSSGVRKSFFYFLKPGYWTGNSGDRPREDGVCGCMRSSSLQDQDPPEDEDVLGEESLLKQQTRERIDDPSIAVQIFGIEKEYPAATNIISCFKCKKNQPYHALKGLWVNIRKDQVFCLLGHNGAGKSTAMNCLTGITMVTRGDALIYGHSIRSSHGVSEVRRLIGVCPQFDTLWDSLSGKEHLDLFASIKGVQPASIQHATNTLLEKVKLTEAARVRSGSYSGGMKRRLSVAIAFIGNPKLVVLDEPTTGMDPITRRHVWDMIEEAKSERAIVLTTHSMEEADILSDRIGIMAKGKLRCIGTPIRLKTQFGAGFIASLSFACSSGGKTPTDDDFVYLDRNQEAVKHLFKNGLDVVPKEENKSFLTFAIPPDREVLLPDFFEELQDREEELGIIDIHIGLTTLEEVFLNISRQAELETAIIEGRSATLTLTSGLSIEISLGAKFVGIQGSETEENPRGVMVEVYWDQDDSGCLCISGHSHEIPIPLGVAPMLPLDSNSKARGVLIDPNQIVTSNAHN